MIELPTLNLPSLPTEIIFSEEGKHWIFDIVRRKKLVLTPEEWVRQHLIHWLIQEGYPKNLLSLEKGTTTHKLAKRTDLVAYHTQGVPFLLLECKAPSVALNHKALQQLLTYNTSLKAPYLGLSNGLQHYFWRVDAKQSELVPMQRLPSFSPRN